MTVESDEIDPHRQSAGKDGKPLDGDEVAGRGVDERGDLDYSREDVEDKKVQTLQAVKDYDPRPQEDGARRVIAYLLIGLLWLLVSAVLILLGFGTLAVSDLKEIAVLLGPIVTLVSAATGFYYGTKTSK